MSILVQQAVQNLERFRADLLAIEKDKLNFGVLQNFISENRTALDVASNMGPRLVFSQVVQSLTGHNTSSIEVLNAVRHQIIEFVDRAIHELDGQHMVLPILDTYILRVTDTKLSRLLKEFNAAKDISPNFAAIGFRTILALIVQQRAKTEKPDSVMAKTDDLRLDPAIDFAIDQKLFPSGELKYLKTFRDNGRKALCDNIVHKPGANMLIEKGQLSIEVDLLNRLLPTII